MNLTTNLSNISSGILSQPGTPFYSFDQGVATGIGIVYTTNLTFYVTYFLIVAGFFIAGEIMSKKGELNVEKRHKLLLWQFIITFFVIIIHGLTIMRYTW